MAAKTYMTHTTPISVKAPRTKATTSIRRVILKNGMECLLISDTVVTSTAISLSINTGSGNDTVPGIAHLMEHTIFTSSKSYPKPYYLPQTVIKIGGQINAFTTYNQTNFHMEAPDPVAKNQNKDTSMLNHIIGVFAAAFREPKFNISLIKNEVFEINEEHLGNISSMDKRFYHCLKLISTTKFRQFGAGNSESLKMAEKKLLQTLKSYYLKYYTATNMKLAISGSQSLNILQEMVQTNFESLHKGPDILKPLYMPVFDVSSKNILLYSEDHRNKVRLVFPINQLNDKLLQLTKIWIELLGTEQANCLCDYLKHQNWVTDLLVFDQMVDIDNLLIIIEMKLTFSGKQKLLNVISSVFSYIQFFADSGSNDIDRFIQECVKVEKLNFIYQEPFDCIMDEVVKYSEWMHYVDFPDIFLGHKLTEITSRFFQLETQRWLNFHNFNLIAFADTLDEQLVIEWVNKDVDKFYNISYALAIIDKTQVLLSSLSKIPFFKFPPQNPFLNYTHKELDSQFIQLSEHPIDSLVSCENIEVPELIEYSDRLSIWYKQERHFNSKIYTTFEICTDIQLTSDIYMAIDIITELAGGYLRKQFYHSETLGYTWSIYPTLNSQSSICFNFNGLTHDYILLFRAFVTHIIQFLNNIVTLPYSEFMKARIKVRKNYEELFDIDPLHQSLGILTCMLDKDVFTIDERLESLMEIEFDTITFVAQRFLQPTISVLINGDCNELVDDISGIINYFKPKGRHPIYQGGYMPLVGKSRYEYPSKENNHCFFYIHLGKRQSLYVRTISKIVEYILSLYVPKLRFERKLGYTLCSGLKIFRETIGVYIYVESNEFDYETLDINIEDFLYEIYLDMSNYSQLEFEQHVIKPCLETLQSDTGISPNSAYDIEPSQSSTNFAAINKNYLLHKNYWEKIVNRTYRFQAKNGQEEIDVNILRSINISDMLKVFNDKINPQLNIRSILLITNKNPEDYIKTQKQKDFKFWRKSIRKFVEVSQKETVIDINQYHTMAEQC